MKKLLLAIQGYKLIDEISGMWKIQYKNMSGKDIVMVEYSKFWIYYNEKKDLYKMVRGGFKPFQHFLNGELMIMLDFINMKPENDYIGFSETVQDYFTQKESLFHVMSTGFGEVKATPENSELIILRFELNQDKEYIMSMREDDQLMGKILQDFKKSGLLSKGIEIYEEHNNILITSDGYYVCTHKSIFNKLDNDSKEEDEDQE